jgi:hypothetical protein
MGLYALRLNMRKATHSARTTSMPAVASNSQKRPRLGASAHSDVVVNSLNAADALARNSDGWFAGKYRLWHAFVAAFKRFSQVVHISTAQAATKLIVIIKTVHHTHWPN